MILITGMYNVQGTLEAGHFIVQNVGATVELGSPAFTQMAVSTMFGNFGQIFVALAVFFLLLQQSLRITILLKLTLLI